MLNPVVKMIYFRQLNRKLVANYRCQQLLQIILCLLLAQYFSIPTQPYELTTIFNWINSGYLDALSKIEKCKIKIACAVVEMFVEIIQIIAFHDNLQFKRKSKWILMPISLFRKIYFQILFHFNPQGISLSIQSCYWRYIQNINVHFINASLPNTSQFKASFYSSYRL